MFLGCQRRQSTRRKSTRKQGKHANSTKKGSQSDRELNPSPSYCASWQAYSLEDYESCFAEMSLFSYSLCTTSTQLVARLSQVKTEIAPPTGRFQDHIPPLSEQLKPLLVCNYCPPAPSGPPLPGCVWGRAAAAPPLPLPGRTCP